MSETFTHYARRAIERASRGRLTLAEAKADVAPLRSDVTPISAEQLADLLSHDGAPAVELRAAAQAKLDREASE